jgi:membrane protein
LQAADENSIPFLASALTFDALLAAVPFVLLLLVGLSHLAQLSAQASSTDITGLFDRFLPTSGMGPGNPFDTVKRLLTRITANRGTVSLYALPLFIWFSTRLFSSVRTGLNEIFDVSVHSRQRHFVVGYLFGKLRDAGMVLATVILFLANTLLSAGLTVVQAWGTGAKVRFPVLGFFVTSVGGLLTQALAFGFSLSLFFLLYKYASIRRLPWRAAVLASAFTAALFEVAKRIFGWYLHVAAVNRLSMDANFGALVMFVVWLYYTSLVFLLGAVVAETWDLRERQRRQEAVLL